MKNILLGMFLLGCVTQAQAQERFFKLIDGFLSTMLFETDSSYQSIGGDYATFQSNVYIFNALSKTGTLNDTWTFAFDSCDFSEPTLNQATNFNGKWLLGGVLSYPHDVFTNAGTLIEFSEDFRDTLKSKTFNFGNQTFVDQIAVVNSNKIIVTTDWVSNNVGKVKLIELDSQFNIQWSRTYPPSSIGTGNIFYPIQLQLVSGGGYLMTCLEQYYSNGLYSQRPVLIKTNSQGIQQWRRYVGDANYLCEGGYAVPSPDGGWLVAWSAPSATGVGGDANREDGIRIEKINTSGVTEWTRHLGWFMDYQTDQYNYFPKQFQTLPDGNYLVSGYMFSKAFLLKVSPLGDPIWYRVYADPYGADNNVIDEVLIYSTTPTSDGGFICAGEYRSDPGGLFPNLVQSAFAMKLDEYGCLEPGCQVADAVEEVDINTATTITISPNPSTGLYYINQSSDAPLLVYDINGQLLQHYAPHTAQIDLSHLAAGLYILSIGTDKQRLIKL